MRIEIGEAIDLILTLPAHRSAREAHRKLGEHAFDLLLEYKHLGQDDTEKAYNRAMICSIFSTVRAFSIERDRISEEWEAIAAIKDRRERLLGVIRNISPLEKGNYWSKMVAVLAGAGLAIGAEPTGGTHLSVSLDKVVALAIGMVVVIMLGLEIGSKVLEFVIARAFEEKHPIKREEAWQKKSVEKYKDIVGNFIDKAVVLYREHYPHERELCGFRIDNDEKLRDLKESLIKNHFFY